MKDFDVKQVTSLILEELKMKKKTAVEFKAITKIVAFAVKCGYTAGQNDAREQISALAQLPKTRCFRG